MRGSLGSFIERRKDAVATLRSDGDPELARRIGTLRKPSVVLWALNQSGAVAPDDLQQLREVTEAMRNAQEQVLQGDRNAAGRLQESSKQQRQLTDTISRRLGMVLSAGGNAAPDTTLRRLADALRDAATVGGPTWDALQAGRLLEEPQSAAFPMLDVPLRAAPSDDSPARSADDSRDLEAEQRVRRRRDAVAALQRALDIERTSREQRDAAQQRHQQAERDVEQARAQLQGLTGN